TLNRNLERQNALAFQEFKERKQTRLRSAFRPLVTGQVIQIIVGALLALIGGSFWVDHIGAAHLMIYGVSLHLYGLMFILFAARDLYLIKQADYAAPVLVLQKNIAALRSWHVWTGVWFGIVGCFIWIPAMLLIFYGLGADVWIHNPDVVGWFVLSAMVCLGVMAAIVFLSRRPGRENFAKRLEASSVGRSVRRAQAEIDEIEAFERD
ncbi:MAG: hypothetical protein ABI233_04990, partial [Chthoniobacterales bacterium]